MKELTVGHIIEESAKQGVDGGDEALLRVLGIKNASIRLDLLALFGKRLYDLEDERKNTSEHPERRKPRSVSGYSSSSSLEGDAGGLQAQKKRRYDGSSGRLPPSAVKRRHRAKLRRTTKTRGDWNEAVTNPPTSKEQKRVLRRYEARTLEDAMTLPGSSSSSLFLRNSMDVECQICSKVLKLNNPYQPSDVYRHLDTERHYEVKKKKQRFLGT
jgi:hypothetical protein